MWGFIVLGLHALFPSFLLLSSLSLLFIREWERPSGALTHFCGVYVQLLLHYMLLSVSLIISPFLREENRETKGALQEKAESRVFIMGGVVGFWGVHTPKGPGGIV